jgi:hypothetical protein
MQPIVIATLPPYYRLVYYQFDYKLDYQTMPAFGLLGAAAAGSNTLALKSSSSRQQS